MYKKILVPLDGSELAESVLMHAVPLAKMIDAEIALFRVVALPVSAFMTVGEPQLTVGMREDAEADALEYLNGVAAKLRAEGIKATAEIGNGIVAETIRDYAKKTHTDLIAMSTHGRGGLARLMIGSVADQLVRDSHLPVLLIRPK